MYRKKKRWVRGKKRKSEGKESGISVPQYVVPHAVDFEKFKGPFKNVLDGAFFFYTIMEANNRKNLGALIKAFHTEFAIDENVQLVVKISKPGQNPKEVFSHVS